jgi:hypothetical protein
MIFKRKLRWQDSGAMDQIYACTSIKDWMALYDRWNPTPSPAPHQPPTAPPAPSPAPNLPPPEPLFPVDALLPPPCIPPGCGSGRVTNL